MRRDLVRPIGRAAWIQLANAVGHPCHEFRVQFSAPISLTLAAPGPCLGIVQARGFGTLKRRFLDEESLSLGTACARGSISAPPPKVWVTGGRDE